MLNHPYFTPIVAFVVALAIGLYLQAHHQIIPDLSLHFAAVDTSSTTTATTTGTNKIADDKKNVITDIDASGWNQWQRVRHWPDEGALWPSPRLAHASASVKSEEMYMFGGLYGGTTKETSPPKILDDFWRYDEFHDRWHPIQVATGSPAPAARLHHTLAATDDGKKIVLFGGFDGFVSNPNHKSIDDGVWIFDISENTWTNYFDAEDVKNRPTARGSHETVIIGDNLYLFGGFPKIGANFSNSAELWKFDLKTYKWKKLSDKKSAEESGTPFPEGRQGFPMIEISSTQVYLFGGNCEKSGECNDEWILDVSNPDAPTWSQLKTSGDVPSARRASHADVSIHDHIFLFGGLSMSPPPTPPKIHDDFHVLDLKTKTWKKIAKGSFGAGTRPSATFGHTCVHIRDKIVLFGGRTSTMASPGSNEVWEYMYSESHDE